MTIVVPLKELEVVSATVDSEKNVRDEKREQRVEYISRYSMDHFVPLN